MRRLKTAEMLLMRSTVKYTLLNHEEILEEHGMDPTETKLSLKLIT
jgi:hypothetical protein